MKRSGTLPLRAHFLVMLLLGLLVFLPPTLLPAFGQNPPQTETPKPWTGRLADGRVITRADLHQILQAHSLWLNSELKEGQRANLSGADLRKADLRETNLSGAKLREANLIAANLSAANLIWADLRKADLRKADLIEAKLREANLSAANLSAANLSVADLSKANLSRANLVWADLSLAVLRQAVLSKADLSRSTLYEADLSKANLIKANLSNTELIRASLYRADLGLADLSKANLSWANLREADLSLANLSLANLTDADLSGANFQPKSGTVSDATYLLSIWGLTSLLYKETPHSLVELRETYKKAGMREPERQVTYALNHNRREKLWEKGGFLSKVESLFNLVFFEWPCQYGLNPGRPLELLGLGLFVFTPFYLLALRSRNRETGIWLVLPPDRIIGGGKKVRPFKLTGHMPFRPLPPGHWSRVKARLRRGLRRVRLAFYFSLLSAFNLGWRELNVGNWISRLQKNEYNLRATGWVRTVAGLQSLLSVYLLALWVLTYFGRPFD